MYKIGLTGGIASGKSTVSNWLRDHGAPIIDADVAAHRVVEPGQPGLKAVVAEFGDGILQDDGTLHRKALGAIVFGDEPKRQKLNEILHKYIYDYMMAEEAKFEADGATAVIYDVPLLIEAGWYKDMDEVWLVAVSEETQLQRLMTRDDCDAAAAKARMKSQMPTVDKMRYSHVIIDNNGTPAQLEERLQALWAEKSRLFHKAL